jgi:asparagine synthase (glutamine-hydrolysing)
VIAALASELGANISTVTLAFDEYAGTRDDEAPLAESVAKILGTGHRTVRISRDTFAELLHDFLDCMDQPTTDGLNTYLVSYAAKKQGLKVALSGLGGDELLGGYPSFRQIPRLVKWGRHLPSSKALARHLRNALRSLGLKRVSPKLVGLLSHSRDIPNAYFLRRALHLEEELVDGLDERTLSEGLHRLSTPLKPGELRELMMESVRYHLIADVPVGVFLSAGLARLWFASAGFEILADRRFLESVLTRL